MYDMAMDEIDELRKELREAQEEINRLKGLIQHGTCKKCGGVSWDIPLADYCKCDKYGRQAKIVEILASGD